LLACLLACLSLLHINKYRISDSQFTSIGSTAGTISSHCALTKYRDLRPAHGLRCALTAAVFSTYALLPASLMRRPRQVLGAKVCMPSSSSFPFLSRAASLLFALIITSNLLAVALSSVRELLLYIGLQLGCCWIISATSAVQFVVMVSVMLAFFL
jgi:hypothetical protein